LLRYKPTNTIDGTPRKLLDVRRMEQLGWKVKTDLEDGVKMTHEWFKVNTR